MGGYRCMGCMGISYGRWLMSIVAPMNEHTSCDCQGSRVRPSPPTEANPCNRYTTQHHTRATVSRHHHQHAKGRTHGRIAQGGMARRSILE
jgi:hypothetical protein